MASLAYFPLYPKDFLGATGRLNAEKFGIYTRLLFTSWFEPLDNDMSDLAFLAGSSEALTKQVLDRYFILKDDIWVNQRLEKERKAANDKHKKAVESGKKGAEKRWGEDSNPISPPNSTPNGNPNSRDLSKTIATHNSEPITHNTKQITHKERYAPHAIFADINDGKIQSYEKGQITKLCQEYSQELVISTIEKMGDAKWHSIKSLKGLLDGSIKIERGAKEGAISTIA